MAVEGTQGLGYGAPTEESIEQVQAMEEDEPGALEIPKSDVGSVEPGMTPADDLEETIHQQFLSDQMAELEVTIQRLGLGAGEAPVPSVAPGTEGERAAPVLAGFVRAADSSPTTLQNLEKEIVTLKMDSEQGVFSLEGWESVSPPLPEKSGRLARGLTHGEIKDLVCSFSSNLLTPDLVARIFEVYVISKRSFEYNEMLKVKHTKQRGGAMGNLKENDPGALDSSLVCMNCYMPSTSGPRCLSCKCTDTARAQVAKDAGSLDAGDLGQAPTPAAATGADRTLVSFSEQVPASQRISMRQQITEMGQDDVFSLRQDHARPPTVEELDETLSAVIFHPKSIAVVKFKAELLTTGTDITQAVESKRRKIEAQSAEERQQMDEELQVLAELQRGPQEVEEAEGVATLRKLDLQVFRSYLKRKHEEQGSMVSMEGLEEAQSSLAQAKQSNKDVQEEFRMKRQLLKPIAVAPFSAWPDDLRLAWERRRSERKLAVMDSIMAYHMGEVRAWGGYWAPDWAKSCDFAQALALECRTNPINMDTYAPTSWTHKEVLDQFNEGKRPDMKKVVGYFWAPEFLVATGTDGLRHFVRRVLDLCPDLPGLE
eukprot:s1948_g14.t1